MPPREEALRMAVCGASHVSGAAWHVQPTQPNFPVRHYSVLPAVGPFLFSFFPLSCDMPPAPLISDYYLLMQLLFIRTYILYQHLINFMKIDLKQPNFTNVK
jgi:hypothetical protein